jgi:multidrug efflux pump subunit AcrB
VVVNIIGNEFEDLREAAQATKDKLSQVPGLHSVLIDMPPPQKENKVFANKENASLLGVSLSEIFHHAELALYGEVVSNVQRGLEAIPIRQLYEGNFRNDIDSLMKIPIFTQNGGILPLGKLASFKLVDQDPEIHHKNGALVMSVTAEIAGRPLGAVVKDIKNALASLKGGDYIAELAGDYQNQQKSFRELLFVLLISIVLILAALLFIFESYKTSLAVFLGTLCSATLVIFGLFITRTEFDVSSFTGMIAVMGIVVNNGILVIDFVERFRREGKSVHESIWEAGQIRFRPVLITNLAAMAGFIPMAFNIGHGGEVLRPFSIAMISGLIGSMVFSLVFMPVFYDLLHRERVKKLN